MIYRGAKMPCSQYEYSPLFTAWEPSQLFPGGPLPPPEGTSLVASNAPETIGGFPFPGMATHYKGTVNVNTGLSGSHTVRIYFWHSNPSGQARTFAIRLMALESSQRIMAKPVRRELQVGSFGQFSVPGKCLAKAQLYSSYENAPDFEVPIGSEGTPWSAEVEHGQLAGAVYELTFGMLNAFTLQVRTVVTNTPGQFGTPQDTPVPPQNPNGVVHIRGRWPHSKAKFPANLLPFDVNPLAMGPELVQCGVCEPNGPELAWPDAFGHDPNDIHGTVPGNKGTYGANDTYAFQVTNSHLSQFARTWVYMRTRNNVKPPPGRYWGAARIVAPQLYQEAGVPSLRYFPPGADPHPNFVELTELIPLWIGPQWSGELAVEVANGGASPLPVSLVVARQAIEAVPSDEPLP